MTNEEFTELLRIASDPTTPNAKLRAIYVDPNNKSLLGRGMRLQIAVAKNPNCDADLLYQCISINPVEVIQNPTTSVLGVTDPIWLIRLGFRLMSPECKVNKVGNLNWELLDWLRTVPEIPSWVVSSIWIPAQERNRRVVPSWNQALAFEFLCRNPAYQIPILCQIPEERLIAADRILDLVIAYGAHTTTYEGHTVWERLTAEEWGYFDPTILKRELYASWFLNWRAFLARHLDPPREARDIRWTFPTGADDARKCQFVTRLAPPLGSPYACRLGEPDPDQSPEVQEWSVRYRRVAEAFCLCVEETDIETIRTTLHHPDFSFGDALEQKIWTLVLGQYADKRLTVAAYQVLVPLSRSLTAFAEYLQTQLRSDVKDLESALEAWWRQGGPVDSTQITVGMKECAMRLNAWNADPDVRKALWNQIQSLWPKVAQCLHLEALCQEYRGSDTLTWEILDGKRLAIRARIAEDASIGLEFQNRPIERITALLERLVSQSDSSRTVEEILLSVPLGSNT